MIAKGGVAVAKQQVKRRRIHALLGLLVPPSIFLLVCYLGPLGIMFVYSWLEPGAYGGVVWNFYSLNYGRIFGWANSYIAHFDPIYLLSLWLSIKLAVYTVILSLIICYPAAFWISRQPGRRKNFFFFLIALPFFISQIIRLFAWVLILTHNGFVNHVLLLLGIISEPLDLIYTHGAVVVGMVYIFLPFMFLPLYASIEKLDMSVVEASLDLGATRLQTFLRVVLPATIPGIAGGSIIVFIPTVGNFIVPQILGGAKVLMIGNLIEQQFLLARNWPFGAALGMMVIMLGLLLVLLSYVRRIGRQKSQRGEHEVDAGIELSSLQSSRG